MAPKKSATSENLQDDYYAHIGGNTKNDAKNDTTKKTLKIKKKTSSDADSVVTHQSTVVSTSEETIKKPKIIQRKAPTESPVSAPKESAPVSEKPQNTARLVEREHASKDLIKSAFSKAVSSSSSEAKPEASKPSISFG